MVQAVFEHDCECCAFLGHAGGFDHYHCVDGSLIARFGRDGDYVSLPTEVVRNHPKAFVGSALGITHALFIHDLLGL